MCRGGSTFTETGVPALGYMGPTGREQKITGCGLFVF